MALLRESASSTVFEIARDRDVLVCKRLPSRMVNEKEANDALGREARALQALDGRGAPRWIADGKDERGPYLVMERVPFASLVQRIGHADLAFHDRVVRSAFSSLDVVHRARDARGPLAMVHADLSPSNVLVSDSGDDTRLIDLGLASWRDAPRDPGGAFRGTLLYVAPEVARGETFDERADTFALAASLAHVANGAPLRTGTSSAALLSEAAEKTIDPSPLEGRFSPDILHFLQRCLAFDPKDRPRGVLPPGVEHGHANHR